MIPPIESHRLHRRRFLHSVAGLASVGLLSHRSQAQQKRLRVAAILTEFTHRSHAHVILENFLEPYYFNGLVTNSGCDILV